jgi:hypothetical protein
MSCTFQLNFNLKNVIAAISLAAVSLSAHAGLANSSFETGTLAGWSTNGALITSAQAHTGTYSVAAEGDEYVRQDFAAVNVSDITNLSFWVRRLQGGNLDFVEFFYSDATTSIYIFNTLSGGSTDWTFADLTGQLVGGKSLTGFLVYGTSSGPAYLDDFKLVTTADGNQVPEPASLALLGLGFAGMAVARRRKSQ